LTELLKTTLTSLVESQDIDFVSVTARTKTLESFLSKATKDKYTDPTEEIFDICAARVITYVEADIERVTALIRRSFTVLPEHSPDKGVELGIDRTGYRSVHLVCEFGQARCALPEFEQYAKMRFEIQVRTALQHAWAEIEHDRQYKVSGVLPSHLRRRFHVLAGVLELADREFDAIVKEIDVYAREVASKAEAGDLAIEINSTSLLKFFPSYLRKHGIPSVRSVDADGVSKVIDELHKFGISTLEGLRNLLSPEFLATYAKIRGSVTLPGTVRAAMMCQDIDRYLDDAWQGHWTSATRHMVTILTQRYGPERVREALTARKIGMEE
jgi:ppGpp synthetase/RelA/SpoT-type nucleotidyltranferase